LEAARARDSLGTLAKFEGVEQDLAEARRELRARHQQMAKMESLATQAEGALSSPEVQELGLTIEVLRLGQAECEIPKLNALSLEVLRLDKAALTARLEGVSYELEALQGEGAEIPALKAQLAHAMGAPGSRGPPLGSGEEGSAAEAAKCTAEEVAGLRAALELQTAQRKQADTDAERAIIEARELRQELHRLRERGAGADREPVSPKIDTQHSLSAHLAQPELTNP
jgi:hypothetical protein